MKGRRGEWIGREEKGVKGREGNGNGMEGNGGEGVGGNGVGKDVSECTANKNKQ